MLGLLPAHFEGHAKEAGPTGHVTAHEGSRDVYVPWTWAARYNTWLLIKLAPKGVDFSFSFFSFSFLFFTYLGALHDELPLGLSHTAPAVLARSPLLHHRTPLIVQISR